MFIIFGCALVDREHQIIIEVQDSPDKIAKWIDELMQSAGADLQLDGESSSASGSVPVVLVDAEPGNWILLDISSASGACENLNSDAGVRLCGQRNHKKIISSSLTLGEIYQSAGRTFCYVSYPTDFQVLVRRNAFRAELRKGLVVQARLRPQTATDDLHGTLRDLSVTGCQLQLPAKSANILAEKHRRFSLSMTFPNGSTMVLEAELRHHHVEVEAGAIYAGFEFQSLSSPQSRSLWYCVREIEREFARGAGGGRELKPSPLFERTAGEPPASNTASSHYATPMARLLAHSADYISTQILALKSGENIDSVQLSRQADYLLSLLHQDREAALFALCCINDQPPLVQHCLAVAVRLTDIANSLHMPREAIKAIAACGMIHDIGKALLPQTSASSVDGNQHVTLLRERLTQCRWLSQEVIREVVEQINERNDGSGYPRGLSREDISELGRLAAVVDEVEVLRAGANGQGPMTATQARENLISHSQQFEDKWSRFYFRHFGEIPVGSLVRFDNGHYGWVSKHDLQGHIDEAYSISAPMTLTADNSGDISSADKLQYFGAAREVIHL